MERISTKFAFDDSWARAKYTLNKLTQRAIYADKLERFVLHHDIDEAKQELERTSGVPAENLERIFMACEHLGIGRIFIGLSELVGADGAEYPDGVFDGTSPAIWCLKDRLVGTKYAWVSAPKYAFSGSCGNSDQYQIRNIEYYIDNDRLDKAYNVKTRAEIDRGPFNARMVVGRKNLR